MLNPLYNLLKNAMNNISPRLQAEMTHKAENEQRDKAFFMVNCPKCPAFSLKIENQERHISEHHISIYAEQSLQEKFLSAYHYTMTLGTDHLLHVYFNRFDMICVEPYVVNTKTGKKTMLSEEQQDKLFIQAVQMTQPIIAELRRLQTVKINDLRTRDKQLEEQLVSLSQVLIENKTAFIKILEQRIILLSELNLYLLQPENGQLSFSEKMLAVMNSPSFEVAPEPAASSSSSPSSSSAPNPAEEEKAKAKKKGKKKASTQTEIEPTEENDAEITRLFAEIIKRCGVFKSSKSPEEKFALCQELMRLTRLSMGYAVFSKNAALKAEATRQNFITIRLIEEFLSSELSIKDPLLENKIQFMVNNDFKHCLKSGDKLLQAAIEADNVKVMTMLISADITASQQKVYAFDQTKAETQNTLLDWCVLKDKTDCFTELLKLGYSPYANLKPSSPLFGSINNIYTFMKFFKIITENSKYASKIEALKHTSRLCKNALNEKLTPKELEIIELKIKLFESLEARITATSKLSSNSHDLGETERNESFYNALKIFPRELLDLLLAEPNFYRAQIRSLSASVTIIKNLKTWQDYQRCIKGTAIGVEKLEAAFAQMKASNVTCYDMIVASSIASINFTASLYELLGEQLMAGNIARFTDNGAAEFKVSKSKECSLYNKNYNALMVSNKESLEVVATAMEEQHNNNNGLNMLKSASDRIDAETKAMKAQLEAIRKFLEEAGISEDECSDLNMANSKVTVTVSPKNRK